MDWLDLPASADCAACHSTDAGIGTRDIPALAHPLTGWTNCTACHADDRLVKSAPGHTGIHAGECLMCHQSAAAPDIQVPLSRPHRHLQNQECLSCHGSTAPLPADMSHRGQNVCWLCHRLPQIEPPLAKHTVTAGQKDCLTCHVAGRDGALPDDHATRTGSECLLCHEPREMVTPPPIATPLPPGQISAVPLVPITAVGWWTTFVDSR
jgi:hypothetical protein